jgi:hypothetical protein
MYYNKTLRWLEPFGGWGDHSNFFDYIKPEFGMDTGFCNRIFHWEVAYYLNEKNNFQYRILLQDMFWPELEILELPYTSPVKMEKFSFGLYYPMEFNMLKFLTVYDVKNMKVSMSESLSKDNLEKMFLHQDYSLPDNIHSDFGYDNLIRLLNIKGNPNLYDHLPIFHRANRPLRKINIKYSFIRTLLENFTKECVGIHIRRHNGVCVREEDIETVPENIREDYREFIKKTNSLHNAYKYYNDEYYFNIIDNILRINPNQKFYISSDLPRKFLNHYYEKYGDNILDNQNVIRIVTDFLVDSNHDIYKLNTYGNVIENIVDLFSLSFCDFLIMSNKSTWSEFAEHYKNRSSVYVTEDIEKIKDIYLKTLKTFI